MATLTLTVGASADDAAVSRDIAYNDTGASFQVGGVANTGTNTNYGQGWRFTGVTLTSADTINSAIVKLMKATTQWNDFNNRWTCVNEDNTATFSSGSPPGSRAIVATIVADNTNVNDIDGTVYNHPRAGAGQTSFGGAIANVLSRGSWASGNALAVVNNSDQDASANESYARKTFHTWDSSVTDSEPQLVIDYTAAEGTAFLSRLGLLHAG